MKEEVLESGVIANSAAETAQIVRPDEPNIEPPLLSPANSATETALVPTAEEAKIESPLVSPANGAVETAQIPTAEEPKIESPLACPIVEEKPPVESETNPIEMDDNNAAPGELGKEPSVAPEETPFSSGEVKAENVEEPQIGILEAVKEPEESKPAPVEDPEDVKAREEIAKLNAELLNASKEEFEHGEELAAEVTTALQSTVIPAVEKEADQEEY